MPRIAALHSLGLRLIGSIFQGFFFLLYWVLASSLFQSVLLSFFLGFSWPLF